MKEMAQKLARAYGAVRNQMGANGRLKQSWLPRGLSIGTGEERPDIGESGQARFVFVDVVREDVIYDSVTQIQQHDKHQLAEFMTLYLGWVSANWDRIPIIFQDAYQCAKEIFISEAYSGRINESIAKLCGGLEIVLTFVRSKALSTKPNIIVMGKWQQKHGRAKILSQSGTALSYRR